MIIKKLNNIKSFKALDLTNIKEILHNKNDNINFDFSLAHASLEIGEKSLCHVLEKSLEIYFILKGKGRMFIDDEDKIVESNDTIIIPAGAKQFIENIGETKLEFLCIVSPPWSEEDEKLCLKK